MVSMQPQLVFWVLPRFARRWAPSFWEALWVFLESMVALGLLACMPELEFQTYKLNLLECNHKGS